MDVKLLLLKCFLWIWLIYILSGGNVYPFFRNNSLRQNSAFWQSIIRIRVQKRPLDHRNTRQEQKALEGQKLPEEPIQY